MWSPCPFPVKQKNNAYQMMFVTLMGCINRQIFGCFLTSLAPRWEADRGTSSLQNEKSRHIRERVVQLGIGIAVTKGGYFSIQKGGRVESQEFEFPIAKVRHLSRFFLPGSLSRSATFPKCRIFAQNWVKIYPITTIYGLPHY